MNSANVKSPPSTPLWPDDLVWSGVIDVVYPDGSWGLTDGSSRVFRVPLPERCGVGTAVEFYEREMEISGERCDAVMAINMDNETILYGLARVDGTHEIVGQVLLLRGD